MSFVFMTSDGTVSLNTRKSRQNVRVYRLRLDVAPIQVSSHEYDGKQQPNTVWKAGFSRYCGVQLCRREFLRVCFDNCLT